MSNTEAPTLQKQAKQLTLLNDLSTKLQGLISSSEGFYAQIVSLIQDQFNYYGIHIFSAEADGSFILRAQAGAYRNHLQIGHRFAANSAGITAQVIRSKKSYLSNQVASDPHYTNLSLPIETQSELCVPVIDQNGEVLATLNIESDQKDAFDAADQATLEAVASQVAVAINNQRLYAEARSFNSKLQRAVEEKTLELRQAQERILEQQRLLQKENKTLKTLVQKDAKQNEFIGKSPAILSLLAMVDKIAPTSATVLIQGESGTGKELVARRLHYKSDRAEKTYVTVNCGALQEALLESELFGHEKGSFTGAVNQKIGLCEMADGGTLFLDEIGEMSLGIQAKLLRFLQEGEFYRIGGKRPIKVNVRVISATNRDLEVEVKQNRFREDLFYRLNTITLRMPPLRKRTEDIGILFDYFLKNSRFGGSSQDIRKVDPRVVEAFERYDWPGNIRELQNTVERLKILAENHEIKLEDVPYNIRAPRDSKSSRTEPSGEFNVNLPLDEVEKTHILRVLAHHSNNKTKAAHALGITIKTLYNKLNRYGLGPSQIGAEQGENPGLTIAPGTAETHEENAIAAGGHNEA